LARYGYDYLDVRIVDGLSRFTPRKIHHISTVLKVPESTLRHRIHRMLRLGLLRMSINPRYENLGLVPAIVQFKYRPIHTEKLISILLDNPYALCVQRVYGSQSEVFSLFTVPLERKKYLIYYLDRVVDTEWADDYDMEWIIHHHRVYHSSEWYDPENKVWTFDRERLYSKFIKNVDKVGIEEIYELEDKVSNRIQDDYDISLLSAMEDEGDISLSALSTKIGTTVQNLHYHFHKHILKNELVESYIIHFNKYLGMRVLHPVFHIEFSRREYRRAFSDTVEGLSYIEFNSHALDGKKFIQASTMPIDIFMEYINFLDMLMKDGYINSYSHYLMENNIVDCKRKLPYELFIDGSWVFDEEKYLETLTR
jgi:DNA-binding Lrp family transcriptional regulator